MMDTNSTPHASADGAANQAGSFSFSPLKPALSFDQQVQLMRERGLIVDDESEAVKLLSETNYYRLRGYWLTVERNGAFLPGTTLDDIREIYRLDEDLRLWLWSAIGPIEVKARTALAYHLSMACNPLAHEQPVYFANAAAHDKSMRGYRKEVERARRNRVPCVLHNMRKYGDLPIWAAVEIMSMGTVSRLYGNLSNEAAYPDGLTVKQAVANEFDIKPYHLESWLRHLTYIRNLCGHHSRIYNRTMTTKTTLLKADGGYDGSKAFPTLITLMRMYERSWPEQWKGMAERLAALTDAHPSVPLRPLGFPDDWKSVTQGD